MDNPFQKQLNDLFRSFKTLPYLFVGSGFSRRYLGLDTWEQLLRRYASMVSSDPLAYRVFEKRANELSSEYGVKPDIASLLESDFNKKWLNDLDFRSQHTGYESEVDATGNSAFKYDIAQYFQKAISENNYTQDYSDEIPILRKVCTKNVAGIITTNYDCFLESIFKNFQVYTGQDEILIGRTTGIAEIYKIHGCCSKPSSIVITGNDYREFVEKCDYLVAKLLTFFMESPIVFLGYRINDLNIRRILARVAKCIPLEMQEEIRKRIIFVQRVHSDKGETEGIERYRQDLVSNDKKDCLPMTCIRVNSFASIYEALLNVHSKYSPRILQQLKQDIYDLVLTQAPTSKIYVKNLEDADVDNLDIVLGVGVFKGFGIKGYESITAEEVHEDIVLHNLQKKYNLDSNYKQLVLQHTLPVLVKRSCYLPIFEYIEGSDISSIPQKIQDCLNRTYDSFFARQYNDRRGTQQYHSIKEIVSKATESHKQLYKIGYLREDEVSFAELEEFLLSMFQEHGKDVWKAVGGYKSQFKSLIQLYDWMKHKK